jgi:threonine/homoserine/homoserine lactone efflux protein
MTIGFLVKGFIIGFSIAAPVGPIGILCIQRTITHGRLSGLLTGLGAATADGFYGAVAAFGLKIVSNFLMGEQYWIRLIGGIFLLYLAVKIFPAKPAQKAGADSHKGLISDYFSTLLLTVANPLTILSFIAVFAGLGLASTNGGGISALFMVMGVFLGSSLWWLILSGGVSFFRAKFTGSSLGIVNKVSGAIIFIFAILAFASLLKR